MISRKIIVKGAAAAFAVAALAAALPSAASAQSYDQCRRDNNNRGVTGAAIGGLAGGVIGNQASARGRHTENTLLGAGIGAVAGALIGRGDTSCYPYDSAYDNRGYYDNRGTAYDNRGGYYDNSYDSRAYDNRAYGGAYADSYYAAPPPVIYAPPPVYYAPPVYSPPAVVFSFGGGGRGYGGYGYGGHRGRW